MGNVSERQDIEIIMQQLDTWVEKCGSGRYLPSEYVSTADIDFGMPEDFGIQQVREEIRAFAELLLTRNRLGHALEIGLGYFGSC